MRVIPIPDQEFAKACGSFYDAVGEAQVKVRTHAELDTACAGAKKRPIGDAWAWARSLDGDRDGEVGEANRRGGRDAVELAHPRPAHPDARPNVDGVGARAGRGSGQRQRPRAARLEDGGDAVATSDQPLEVLPLGGVDEVGREEVSNPRGERRPEESGGAADEVDRAAPPDVLPLAQLAPDRVAVGLEEVGDAGGRHVGTWRERGAAKREAPTRVGVATMVGASGSSMLMTASADATRSSALIWESALPLSWGSEVMGAST